VKLERWIIENVTSNDVPADEGSSDGLIYNMVQLVRHGRPYERYDYKPEQDDELRSWGIG
jgi:hypothetical protein